MTATLEAMRIFIAVAETGGFTTAASVLGMTQPSVSRQISQLEHALSVQLFRRSTRKLTLTEAGSIYLDRVRTIVADAEEAATAVRTHKRSVSGLLRVAAPTTLGQRRIAPILKNFLTNHDDLEIGFFLSDSYRDMLENVYDVAIRVGEQKTSDLTAIKIAESRSIIAAAPSYLDGHKPITHPHQLGEHNCLRFRQGPGISTWHFQKDSEFVSVEVNGSLFSDTAEALLSAGIAGLGVIHLPVWMTAEAIHQNLLREVVQDWSISPKLSPVYAVFPERKHRSRKVSELVDFLIAELKKEKWRLN